MLQCIGIILITIPLTVLTIQIIEVEIIEKQRISPILLGVIMMIFFSVGWFLLTFNK